MVNKIRYKCQELLDNQLAGNRFEMMCANLKEEFENVGKGDYRIEKADKKDGIFYNKNNY
jgi:hypothetical protein